MSQSLAVAMDPRVETPLPELETQFAFYRELTAVLERVTAAARALEDAGGGREPLQKELNTIGRVLAALATDVEAVDREPTAAQREVLETYRRRARAALAGP